MPAVTVILTVRSENASDLARSARSVSQQSFADWELRVVHGGESDLAEAAAVLAAADPRIAGATDADSALASTSGPILCQLECGARYPTDYLAAVHSAMADGAVRSTLAARIIEHGPRFSRADRVAPQTEPTRSQLAVRRSDGLRPLPQVLAEPGCRPLPQVAVHTRFGEVPVPRDTLTAIVEISPASPPLSIKPQLAGLATAKIPLVVVLSGPVGWAGRFALRGWLRDQGVPVVADRWAALATVDTPAVTFLPSGWEIDPVELSGLADLLLTRNAAAVVPVARDAGGSILGAGMIWADGRSLPQRFLQGHPHADLAGRIIAVPSPHPEGLTMRTDDLRAAGEIPAGGKYWPLLVIAGAGLDGPILVDGRCSLAIPRYTPPAASGQGRRAAKAPSADELREAAAAAPANAVAASRKAMAELGWSVIGVEAMGEQRWRPLVTRAPARTEPVATRRWALKIGAPAGTRGDPWGDVFFADDLAGALRSLGNDVVIDRDGSAGRSTAYLDRVVLNIRGYQVVAPQPGAVNLLWIISHPDDIPEAEMRSFDRVYAASAQWPATVRQKYGIEVEPLLQATNPERFNPDAAAPDTGPDLLFVGNSRHQFRPIVADCRTAGLQPTVIGRDWEKFLPAEEIAALSVANTELPAAYRSAGIVLNDHWGDMVGHGFLNNRLFDAVACGARVVSDDVPGLREVFGDAVAVYWTPEDLTRLCDPARRAQFGTDEQLRQRAADVAAEHSFAARAQRLMQDAAQIPILPQ